MSWWDKVRKRRDERADKVKEEERQDYRLREEEARRKRMADLNRIQRQLQAQKQFEQRVAERNLEDERRRAQSEEKP